MTYRPLSRRYVRTGKPDCMRPKTAPDVLARILALGRTGEPHKVISAECGVSGFTVSRVLIRNGLGRHKRTRLV